MLLIIIEETNEGISIFVVYCPLSMHLICLIMAFIVGSIIKKHPSLREIGIFECALKAPPALSIVIFPFAVELTLDEFTLVL